MAQTFFQVVVRYTVKSGEVDTVLQLLREMAAATDAAGFAAHREYEHIERIGAAQIIPRLASRSIQTFENATDS